VATLKKDESEEVTVRLIPLTADRPGKEESDGFEAKPERVPEVAATRSVNDDASGGNGGLPAGTTTGVERSAVARPSPPSVLPIETRRLPLVLDVDFGNPAAVRLDELDLDGIKTTNLPEEYRIMGKRRGVWYVGKLTPVLSDFVCAVEGRWLSAASGAENGWGIGFGGNPGGADAWPGLQMNSDGRVRLYLYDRGAVTPWLRPPSLKDHDFFHEARVEVRDRMIRFFVNGTYISQAAYEQYRPGRVRLFYYTKRLPVEACFRRIRVWSLPGAEAGTGGVATSATHRP